MPLRKYNKLYTDRPLVTQVFDAVDSVEWTDQDSIHRLGIIAYVALPDTQIPKPVSYTHLTLPTTPYV